MKIKSSFKTYSLDFVDNADGIKEYFDNKFAFFVVDHNVYELYEPLWSGVPSERMYVLNVCEANKTIDTALEICEAMTQMSAKRNSILISVGGGITQDVTGFVANILYRGINWVFYPTTLLAAADSCIGGKTSLNYKSYKNLLGTFYPPDQIIVSPSFFETLTKTDLYCGLGEIAKFNVMTGESGLRNMERDIAILLDGESAAIKTYMANGLDFKRKFIEQDEFDKGVRILLNFAHTFGHALETVSSYAIPHGQAVSMGMLTANHISVQRSIMSQAKAERIENIMKQIINIPLEAEYFNVQRWIEAIRKDKKQTSESLTAILMNEDYGLTIVNDISDMEIKNAIEYLEILFEIK